MQFVVDRNNGSDFWKATTFITIISPLLRGRKMHHIGDQFGKRVHVDTK